MCVCSLFVILVFFDLSYFFFFSSRRRHTRCALVTGVQTCALPISETPHQPAGKGDGDPIGDREGSHDPGSAIRTDAQIARDRRQRNIRDRRIENLHEGSKGKRKGRQGKDPSPQRRRAGLTHSVEPRLAAMICARSEAHTSELQSLMRISYAVFCLKKKKKKQHQHSHKKELQR